MRVYATPRRLAVQITGVLARAPDKTVEAAGPSVKVGLDADGKPTPALLGFARKQGVDVTQLERRDSPRGEVFVCRTMAKGGALETNLDLKVGFALEKLPVPKIMRWGSGDSKFVRPVHGLVMMHGARVVRGQVMDVRSSNRTLGHRVLSRKPVTIRRADDYERALRESGKVIADFGARRAEIAQQLREIRRARRGAVAGDALLDEITALVEAPTAYAGRFSPEFLEVPQECLILSMQQHQRYVPLRDGESGELLPRFLFVSNLQPDYPRDDHPGQRTSAARAAFRRQVLLRSGPQDPAGRRAFRGSRAWSITASSAASSSVSSGSGCWRARSRAGSAPISCCAERAGVALQGRPAHRDGGRVP